MPWSTQSVEGPSCLQRFFRSCLRYEKQHISTDLGYFICWDRAQGGVVWTKVSGSDRRVGVSANSHVSIGCDARSGVTTLAV